MARMRIDEQLSGSGQVVKEDGSPVAEVEYHLEIWQRMIDVGRGDETGGLKSIQGGIRPPASDWFDHMGANLVLILEDRRRVPFAFKSMAGAIVGRGGILPRA